MSLEREKYWPEKNLSAEGVNKVGVVVFVVNPKGEIWTVREVAKPNHQGEVGVLCETRKPGEKIWANTQGALIEEMGVEKKDRGNFLYVDGISYLGRVRFPESKQTIHADVVLILYSGEKEVFSSRNEVSSNGWMKPEELANHPNLRSGVKPALELVLETGAILTLLVSENHRRPILSNVDPALVFNSRQRQPDINFSDDAV